MYRKPVQPDDGPFKPGQNIRLSREFLRDRDFEEYNSVGRYRGVIVRANFENDLGFNYAVKWSNGADDSFHSKWLELDEPPTTYLPIRRPKRKLRM
jgi:hypothetical protein